MIKFPAIAILVFILIATVAWKSTSHRRDTLRKQRQTQYEAALATYQNDLRPGQTRAQVDAVLAARNLPIEELRLDSNSWDKVVRIGREHSIHWYCAFDDIDIRLQFNASAPDAPASPADSLSLISLYTRPRDCL
ncbi:hypothetical protein BH10ACI4_BH10ACI4_21250 [soil metagenome]